MTRVRVPVAHAGTRDKRASSAGTQLFGSPLGPPVAAVAAAGSAGPADASHHDDDTLTDHLQTDVAASLQDDSSVVVGNGRSVAVSGDISSAATLGASAGFQPFAAIV